MKTSEVWISRFFLIFTLIVFSLSIINYYQNFNPILNTLGGMSVAIWICLLLIIIFKLLFNLSFREQLLTKFIGMQTRDEREDFISGRSAKRTHIFIIIIMSVLLICAVLRITFINPTAAERLTGKEGKLMIGIGYQLINHQAIIQRPSELFVNMFPFSVESILTLLLIVQIIAYRIYYRKSLIN